MRPKIGVVVFTPTMTLPRLMISSIVCAAAGGGLERPSSRGSAMSQSDHLRARISIPPLDSIDSVPRDRPTLGDPGNRVNVGIDCLLLLHENVRG
jgi:hypothetical protein